MSGFEMALPMNSGAEAVETAIKAARRWAYRSKKIEPNKAEIIVANGNFHGRQRQSSVSLVNQTQKMTLGHIRPVLSL